MWLEVIPESNLTSQTTMLTFCMIFTTHGLPEIVVSADNGLLFISEEF